MGELLIREGSLFHSVIEDKTKINEDRVTDAKVFAANVAQLLDSFAGELTVACRSFYRKLKMDSSEEENVTLVSKYSIDILNELAKKVSTIGKKLQLDVVDPLAQFSQKQLENHSFSLIRSEQLLNQVQANNDMLR